MDFKESLVEKRCGELKTMARTQAEEEELRFLEDYMRDRPKLRAALEDSRKGISAPGNLKVPQFKPAPAALEEPPVEF